MLRFKLFCFFAGMAFISLFRPKDGMDMIVCARDGAKRRAQREACNAVFGKTQKADSPQGVKDAG